MKNIILTALFISSLFSNISDIKNAVAIGIFDKNGNGENIQYLRKTKNNYDGVCYSKIAVFGNLGESEVEVKIGNSIGHYEKDIPIYNKQKILIGKEITFKHYNISKGYLEVRIDDKLFDSKVFIK